MAAFKDFYIAIGQPGAYSASMQYSLPIGVYANYNIRVKHAPFSLMSKIKNVVSQTWPDEEGDDAFLPQNASGEPTIVHEAVDYNVTFAYHEPNRVGKGPFVDRANQDITRFIKAIEGRWLKIYDSYTGIGYEGVYLQDIDDDPRFFRRNHDTVIFDLSFKVNGRPLGAPLA